MKKHVAKGQCNKKCEVNHKMLKPLVIGNNSMTTHTTKYQNHTNQKSIHHECLDVKFTMIAFLERITKC